MICSTTTTTIHSIYMYNRHPDSKHNPTHLHSTTRHIAQPIATQLHTAHCMYNRHPVSKHNPTHLHCTTRHTDQCIATQPYTIYAYIALYPDTQPGILSPNTIHLHCATRHISQSTATQPYMAYAYISHVQQVYCLQTQPSILTTVHFDLVQTMQEIIPLVCQICTLHGGGFLLGD